MPHTPVSYANGQTIFASYLNDPEVELGKLSRGLDAIVASKDANYTATADDRAIPYACTAARTLTLPAGSGVTAGHSLFVFKTDATAFALTIDGNGSETIDNELTIALYGRAAVELVWGGTQWHIKHGKDHAAPFAPRVNVKWFGAKGDGSTDDTTAIANAITAAGARGTVFFPTPTSFYPISASLVPLENQHWIGPGFAHPSVAGGEYLRATASFNGPLVSITTSTRGVTIEGFSFRGNNASGSKGVYVAAGMAQYLTLRDLMFNNFGDSAIEVAIGSGGLSVFEHIWAQNCVLVDGRSAYVGAIDIGANDAMVRYVETSCSTAAVTGGWRAALACRGNSMFVSHCGCETSEVGVVVQSTDSRFVAVRADLNRGHGFVLGTNPTSGQPSKGNSFVACHAYRNGQDADGTYDGFVIPSAGNSFVGCRIRQRSDGNADDGSAAGKYRQRHGFSDSSNTLTGESANVYTDNLAERNTGQLYNFSGTNPKRIVGDARVSADNGDAAKTLTPGVSEPTQRWNTALTAARAVTLATSGAYAGAKFRIVREAGCTGAFNLNVGTGPLKALTAASQWCEVEYDGSAWRLTANGTL